MTRFAWIVGALALVGCNKDKDGTGDGTDTPVTCTTKISDSSYPYPGQIDFYYQADLVIVFSDEKHEANDFTLMDASGAEVTGTLTWNTDNDEATFSPDAPLSPSTTYTMVVSYCAGEAEISFSTSSLGSEVDVTELPGKAYQIDLGSANFVEPEGIGTVIGGLLEQNILVGVTEASDTTVKMIGAISDADDADGDGNLEEQDPCNPTIDFPEAAFENPHFQVGPETTTISAAGYDITIEDLEIGGDFASDASYFGGGTLSGTVDTRPLAPLLDEGGGEGAICDLVLELEYGECQPCPADGEPFCLTLVVNRITATELSSGLTVLTEDTLPAECGE